jgi:hypothetical protein
VGYPQKVHFLAASAPGPAGAIGAGLVIARCRTPGFLPNAGIGSLELRRSPTARGTLDPTLLIKLEARSVPQWGIGLCPSPGAVSPYPRSTAVWKRPAGESCGRQGQHRGCPHSGLRARPSIGVLASCHAPRGSRPRGGFSDAPQPISSLDTSEQRLACAPR